VIVVDTNVLVKLEIPSQGSEDAQKLVALDPEWRLPQLWRVEFSNAMRNFHRVGKLSAQEAVSLLNAAIHRYGALEATVDDSAVLALAMERDLTTYDCQYLSLALHLGVLLVSEDKELVKKSRGAAVSMAQWLALKG
jgi:predicted nucleic acid-binding protein